jgi:hypothetical protein
MIKLKNIISEIITEYERGEPLIFTHDCVDSYRGQNYCNLIARDKDGNFVGAINFSTYRNQIHISMINTKGTERRKGIATAMAKELQKEYPDYEIIWGMTTTAGSKFIEKLPRTFKAGQWRVKLKEIMSPHRAAQHTDKRRGYIGIVYHDKVEAYDEMVPDVIASNHIDFTHHVGAKWRYFVEFPKNTVLWDEFPADVDDKLRVEDWLHKKNMKVNNHIGVREYYKITNFPGHYT